MSFQARVGHRLESRCRTAALAAAMARRRDEPDELELHVVPLLLGGGARLFDNLRGADVRLEQLRAVEAPGVAHLKYRVRSVA